VAVITAVVVFVFGIVIVCFQCCSFWLILPNNCDLCYDLRGLLLSVARLGTVPG
jgi:hypothetical protein